MKPIAASSFLVLAAFFLFDRSAQGNDEAYVCQNERVRWPEAPLSAPVLSHGSQHYLSLWTQRGGTRYAILDERGAVVGKPGRAISGRVDSVFGNGSPPKLASAGTTHLLVRGDWGINIEGFLLNVEGLGTNVPLIRNGLPFTIHDGHATDPDVAFDGSAFVVAWIGGSGVWVARYTPAGLLVTAPMEIARGGGSFVAPLVACSGEICWVIWKEGDDTEGVSFLSSAPAPGNVEHLGTGMFPSALAGREGKFLIVMDSHSYERTHLAELDAHGLVGPPVEMKGKLGHRPALKPHANGYLMVWEDKETIWNVQVGTGNGLSIGEKTAVTTGTEFALATDGQRAFVTAPEHTKLERTRASQLKLVETGSSSPSAPVVLAQLTDMADVYCADGSEFVACQYSGGRASPSAALALGAIVLVVLGWNQRRARRRRSV